MRWSWWLAAAFAVQGVIAGAQPGILRGTVVDDSTDRPLPGSEVLINGGTARATTDDRGRFAFAGVSPGAHVLSIRHLGYAPLTTEVQVTSAGADMEFGLQRSIAILEGVVVRDSADPLERGKLSEFFRRKQMGIGSFLTRGLFEDGGAKRTSDILQARLPGARIVRSPCGLAAFVATTRFAGSLAAREAPLVCGRPLSPTICLATVLLDGVPVFRGTPGEPPFDVNSLQPGELSAVEYYAGPAQVPSEYRSTSGTCAVIALWTR